MYQLTTDPDSVIRLSDGASIPRGHRFFAEYEAWVAAGGVPEPAAISPAPVAVRHVTRLAFRNRFTQTELVTLEIAGLDDPTAPMVQRQQAAAIRVMMRQVDNATYVDLDRPDTRGGVQQLEAGGLLAAGRALEILDAPVQPDEMPQ